MSLNITHILRLILEILRGLVRKNRYDFKRSGNMQKVPRFVRTPLRVNHRSRRHQTIYHVTKVALTFTHDVAVVD